MCVNPETRVVKRPVAPEGIRHLREFDWSQRCHRSRERFKLRGQYRFGRCAGKENITRMSAHGFLDLHRDDARTAIGVVAREPEHEARCVSGRVTASEILDHV